MQSLLIPALTLMAANVAYADATISGPVSAGADAIFVHWVARDPNSAVQDSARISVTLDPATVTFDEGMGVLLGDISVLPLELTGARNIGNGEVQLTRLKAALLRASLLQILPVEVLSVYRDLDRGIEWGGDLLGLRVPIQITSKGEITILPGLELGMRHYVNGATGAEASFILDARAAIALIKGWLDAGAMARVRYDAVTSGMSGDEEAAMGFLSLSLDSKNRYFIKVYGGVERDANRAKLNMPETNTFVGAGLFGNFRGE
jgi:hypothetical protein